MKSFYVFLLTAGLASAYQHFQQEIPNGDRVPDPNGGIWQGVGHENAQGGGPRNPFGLDFADNNFKWDSTLCNKDSDSDGRTNGEELGDPNCVWSKGGTPSTTSGLSHPGICEPINSVDCQAINSGVNLESGQPFDCPATAESGVISTNYRFPSTNVPSDVTTYFCKYFPVQLSAGQGHHIIAYEPISDNLEVIHHTLVYGCKGDTVMSDSVGSCSGGMGECNELIMAWTVGISGMCYPDIFGTLIGEGGYTGFWMEHHWNNPRQASNLFDSSGIKVYHTPDLRPDEARYVIWGSMNFMLPPGVSEEEVGGECPSERTSRMNAEKFKMYMIIPHMHLLGRKMTIEHKGELILTDDTYDYNSPKMFVYDTPKEFGRGDEIIIKCTFDTTSRTENTYYGDATNDEMCFMVALIYPFDDSIPTFCGRAISGAPRGGMGVLVAVVMMAVGRMVWG